MKNFCLNNSQNQIIIGTILGDGYIENGLWGSRLQIKQSKFRKEYVFWLYHQLKNLCRSFPKQRKDNLQWYFGTRYTQEITKIHRVFYPNRKKIVPKNISDLLTSPLALAIWYMDDDTLDYRPNDHFAFYLMTHSFSVKDVRRLVRMLKDNFAVKSNIFNNLIRGKRYPRIYIGAEGRKRFLQLVKPYILSCFRHKLPPI